MYLVVVLLAAVIVTAIWYVKDSGQYKLGILGFMFWGTVTMILVDNVMSYLSEGGAFIDMSADAVVLGVVMVTVVLVIWEILLILTDPLGKLRGGGK